MLAMSLYPCPESKDLYCQFHPNRSIIKIIILRLQSTLLVRYNSENAYILRTYVRNIPLKSQVVKALRLINLLLFNNHIAIKLVRKPPFNQNPF